MTPSLEPSRSPGALDPFALRRWLFAVVAIVSALGLLAELAYAYTTAPIFDVLTPELSLSGEGNVPTWVSSILLFSSALAGGSIARNPAVGRPAIRRGWWGVCAVFTYASLDEAVQLHEHLGGHIETGGVLYFDWVIPAVVIVGIVAVAFLPFVRALPAVTRTRLVVAGVIYLGGAIAMELPLGWWMDRHGPEGFGYALIDWFEETLEMIGASLALVALVAHPHEETA